MTEAFVIREARLEDIEQIKIIETNCGLSMWLIEDYKNELERKDSIFIVAEIKKVIVGFAMARLITNLVFININSEFINSNTTDKNIHFEQIEIYNIGVYKEQRKKGIGKRLLKKVLKLAEEKKIKEIWLEVRKSNKTALKFYSKSGFIRKYTRKNYYTSPCEDALVLKLKL